jgi:sugar transferase (PEP-CTERM/EpsH1 system associated)
MNQLPPESEAGKTPLLFLCHRIPYPPNKGDKIRSFHLLHHLSRHFDIYLATFIDDPADWPWVPEVQKFCRDALFVGQSRWGPRLRSLRGLITGEALSIPFYASDEIATWVEQRVHANGIRHAMVFSSSMAQFVLDRNFPMDRRVVDFVDVDSDKWQQYSQRQRWPMSWLYRREARRLLAYEERLARECDAGLFVSSAEAVLFRELVPDCADKVGYYNNGVNTEYFTCLPDHASPFPTGIRALVFTGAMDYWPNIDAAVWFVTEVLPALRQRHADLFFYIVGSNPARAVTRLARHDGVVVTGRVDDVRPYLQHAAAAVAPMHVARGVQNKVLEAMAMARPVLVTRRGLEGIDATHGEQVLVAEEPRDYVESISQVLAGEHEDVGRRARSFVERFFVWERNLPEVVLLLAEQAQPDAVAEMALHG